MSDWWSASPQVGAGSGAGASAAPSASPPPSAPSPSSWWESAPIVGGSGQGPSAQRGAPPLKAPSLLQGVKEAIQGVQGVVSQASEDVKTAFTPAPQEARTPLPSDASPADRFLDWFSRLGGTTQNPGGARAQAASNLPSVPLKAADTAISGFMHGAVGLDPTLTHVAEGVIGYLAPGMGAEGEAAGAAEAAGGKALAKAPAASAPKVTPAQAHRVAQVIQEAVRRDAVAPEQIDEALSNGVSPFAAAGPQTAELARQAIGTPGEAQGAIQSAAQGRLASAPERGLALAQTHLGIEPSEAAANVDATVSRLQGEVGPGWDAVRNSQEPLTSPALRDIAATPAGQTALRKAYTDILNRREDPEAAGWKLVGDDPVHGPKIVPTSDPTVASWDMFRRYLNDVVAKDEFGRPDYSQVGNASIDQLRRDLAGELRDRVPSALNYPELLDNSASYLRLRNAYERMQGTLFKGPLSDFQERWGLAQGPLEREAAKSALANDMWNRFNSPQGLDAGDFAAPGVQAKLSQAFGEDRASAFTQAAQAHDAEVGTLMNVQKGFGAGARSFAKEALQHEPAGMIDWIQGALNAPGAAATGHLALRQTARALEAVPRSDQSILGHPGMNQMLSRALTDPAAFKAALKAKAPPSHHTFKRGVIGGALGVRPRNRGR